jgi:NAD(P)-dependent dehydrogenase (short-subunit alcohol dehydrogenase family)
MGFETFEPDISSSESIANFRNKITYIDILFNNAGISARPMSADTPVSTFKRLFDVNVFGTFELTQASIPLLVQSKRCHGKPHLSVPLRL